MHADAWKQGKINRMNRQEEYTGKGKEKRYSLAYIVTMLVVSIVSIASIIGVTIFTYYFVSSVEQNAITSSEQAVAQVQNMVTNYTEDMDDVMSMIRLHMTDSEEDRNEFLNNLINIRNDVESITAHSVSGELIGYWADGLEIKENHAQSHAQNLSYLEIPDEEGLHISAPHVQNLFKNYYPWVVTISEMMETDEGNRMQISMDIRFSNIAEYVDEVGIGAHGYCFIMDSEGNIVYHPQQQLIYAGLKSEDIEGIRHREDGTHTYSGVIYSIDTLENCDWRIVGVSFVDELITTKVSNMVNTIIGIMLIIIMATAIVVIVLARSFSKPAKELAFEMQRFENEAESFAFYPVKGAEEIVSLSDAFGHMVIRVQELMEQVRNEEITLRKTELNALQAQINPHFLYNTLDSIAWMCEEGRTKEAVEMVNALARLFRISISKGYELIPIEQELLHAESYLKIQKFRYKNHFQYRFEVEEDCLGYLCNKITLQPLIENAIVHGLDMADEGEIVIRIFAKEDDIIMQVTDNGIGMTEQQCKEILQKDIHNKGGIGIKNVNDRVKIYFGEKYGVSIFSELDEGTRVEICMPKILEESYEM